MAGNTGFSAQVAARVRELLAGGTALPRQTVSIGRLRVEGAKPLPPPGPARVEYIARLIQEALDKAK